MSFFLSLLALNIFSLSLVFISFTMQCLGAVFLCIYLA